ncbi:MAG: caspase family protein [Rhodocyclaceae bacterium]|nr:caspase family protein [Rhodocyclaceae bacterium]
MKTKVTLCMLMGFVGSLCAQPLPPLFFGGPPGMAQFQAMLLQRHQARTLLYREALEELRKNPQAADVPLCPSGVQPKAAECLAPPVATVSPAQPAAAEGPSAPQEVAKAAAHVPAAPIGRRLALLIGNNGYQPPIPPLDTPIADVRRIGQVLRERFGYEATIIEDAGKQTIISRLNRLASEAKPEDSVLIFYAGHGYQMDDTQMGFWIPVDASVKTARGWISNDDIARLLAAIPARQIILVSDSCFSGSLAREKRLTKIGPLQPDEILRRRSVLVMTSGDEEPVSDEGKEGHSIFAWNLIRALQSAGGLAPGHEIWQTVHRGVTREYPQQPQYGAVVSAGHVEGGEYLFGLR